MVHNMKLHPRPFEMIRCGLKRYELRLFDEKRQKIKPGDLILFTNSNDVDKQIQVSVLSVQIFPDFEALYRALPISACGYLPDELKDASAKDMQSYYSREQQEKYGVIAIEVKLLSE